MLFRSVAVKLALASSELGVLSLVAELLERVVVLSFSLSARELKLLLLRLSLPVFLFFFSLISFTSMYSAGWLKLLQVWLAPEDSLSELSDSRFL